MTMSRDLAKRLNLVTCDASSSMALAVNASTTLKLLEEAKELLGKLPSLASSYFCRACRDAIQSRRMFLLL